MIPKRLTRTLTASGIGLSLVLAMLAMPIVVIAATPDWSADPVVSLPAAVSPGADAGYQLTVRNSGPSNISQLYLYAEGAPAPSYSAPSQGSCANPAGTLFCSLGALRSGTSATIIVAFPTPDDGSTSFSVDFFFNTTGLGSGGGDNSHGDELDVSGTTSLIDDPNYAGGFVVGETVVANGAISGAGNKQSTRLFAPAPNIAVTVEDGPGVPDVCPAGFACVLETSEIHVGDGSDQYGLFKVVIQIDKTALKGLSLKNIDVLHVYDDGTTFDPITTTCPKNGTPSSECATVSSLRGGHGEVTIWLEQNGYIKFH